MSGDLELVFSPVHGPPKRLGPYSCVRFESEVIRDRADGPILARHVEHRWIIDGVAYTRLDCDCRVSVRFERMDGTLSREYGPYDSFSCVDGIAYVDREVFAIADRSIGDWYCHDNGRHWPLMTVSRAAG